MTHIALSIVPGGAIVLADHLWKRAMSALIGVERLSVLLGGIDAEALGLGIQIGSAISGLLLPRAGVVRLQRLYLLEVRHRPGVGLVIEIQGLL